MPDETINIADFIAARRHEIAQIEAAIRQTTKKSVLFQRLPHYQRRRNRSFDQRRRAVHTPRKKDRHCLHSHTFNAKRFFMLRLAHCAVPLRRRLKGDKFVYKAAHRGFFIDESFRGVREWPLGNADASSGGAVSGATRGVCNGDVCDVLADGAVRFLVGGGLVDAAPQSHSCIAVVHGERVAGIAWPVPVHVFPQPPRAAQLPETHRIVCAREHTMAVVQALLNAGLAPAGVEDIERLALESGTLCLYDWVGTRLYRAIEDARAREFEEKYARTPPAKRAAVDCTQLRLPDSVCHAYFTFRVRRGTCTRAAVIWRGEACVGRVVRAAFRFAAGGVAGIAVATAPVCAGEELRVVSLANPHPYTLVVDSLVDGASLVDGEVDGAHTLP